MTFDLAPERQGSVAVAVQRLEVERGRKRAARTAYELRADSVSEALCALGSPKPKDRLLAPRTAQWALALEGFRKESLFFVDDAGVEAFERTTAALRDGEPPASDASAGELWWLVSPLEGRELRVPDLRGLARAAHALGAKLLVDNTMLGRFGCDALELGADVCIEPVAVLDDAAQQRRFDHARALAEYLRCHPGIPRAWYPGFKTNPDYQIAARTLSHGFGPRVVFELPEGIAVAAFLERCECGQANLPRDGSVSRLCALGGDDGQLVCLIAGLDDPIDVADDLDQAHRWFCNPPEP